MGILKNPVVLIWLVVSIILIVVAGAISIFADGNIVLSIIAVALGTFAASILFPILVGYFYEKLKSKETGEAIWSVFRDFEAGGILRVYKDREETSYLENAPAHPVRCFDANRYR